MLKTSLLYIVGLIASTTLYALPFSITPAAGTSLPTNVIPGQTVTALYTVTNNTSTVRTANYVKYLPPSVTQVTSDPTYPDLCGSTFTLNPSGTIGSSCTLELNISGTVFANDPDPHHHLFVCFPGGTTCAGTPNPLNVSSIAPLPFTRAYVANFVDNNVLLCSINSNSGAFNGCADLGIVFDVPSTLAITKAGTRAYVANFGFGGGTEVSLCTINPSTGSFTGCINADGDGSAIFVSPLGVTLDPSNTHVYVGNIGNNTVSVCSVDSSTGKLTGCTVTGGPFVAPVEAALNAAGTHAYVTNVGTGAITLCSVESITGLLTGCVDSGAGAVFNGPALMSFNASETRAYVSDNGGGLGDSVSICSVNIITGTLSACEDSGVGAIFNAPVSVTLNASNTLIYVSNNGSTTVSVCSINPSTGKFTVCSDSGGVFSGGPAGIVLQ